MLNDVRTMYGERLVIHAVPAFMMIIGTLACVTSGALAIALGENTKPASRSTLSRVISSCTSVFATAPPGFLESRLMSSILLSPNACGCSFMYRCMARMIWSPYSALTPENVITTPTFTVAACAAGTASTASAVPSRVFLSNRIIVSSPLASAEC